MAGPARVDRLATVIAFLVATVSIVSAVVAGRAAVWSSTASDIDSVVLQEAIEAQQLEGDLQGAAAADLRLVARYDAAVQRMRALVADAAQRRETDPAGADRLDLEAQAAWGVDLVLWRFFRALIPEYDAEGALVFDVEGAIEAQRAADPRLTELARSATPARAAEARARTIALVGIAVLFVAGLFVLTLAEVWPGRGRWAPLLVGVGLAVGASAITVATDPDTAQLVAAIALVAAVALVAALGIPQRRRPSMPPDPAPVAGDTGTSDARATPTTPAADPSTPPPDPPPGDDPGHGSTRFSAAVAVVLAAATLLGAGVGYLQGAASDLGAAATREAQDQALLALTEHQRTSTWAAAQVEVWSVVEEHRARAAAARQLAPYLAEVGDMAGAAEARADAERWDRAAQEADALTVLSDDHPDGPAADPAFPGRFLARQQEARAQRVALQDLANEAGAAWGARSAAYVAVLATLAIAAYLLGLSLVLRARRLRGMFAVVGVGLVVAAGIAGAATALEPDTTPTPAERETIARAFVRARVASRAARTPADRSTAVAAYREVVGLHPGFARARVELASALFDESSPQTSGFFSVATLDAVRAALAELEAARELGWDDLATRGDTGFYEMLVGLADPESGATARAVADADGALELGPDLPVLRYNRAAALLSDGQLDAAREAYGEAIAATVALDEDGDPVFGDWERAGVIAGAITDLELIAAGRSDRPGITAAVADLKAAIIAGTGDPVDPGAASSPATVSGLELHADPGTLWWQARIDDLDPERDVLSVLWLAEDPAVPGWHVLPGHSGPLRLGERTPAGEFYENGAAPDYFASQGYLLASDPRRCVPDGRYRVELYLNGRLAVEPVERTLDMPDLVTEDHPDLGLLFCRPADWVAAPPEPGSGLSFDRADGTPVLTVARVHRPNPPGDAGAAEVLGVMDAIAASWPGSPTRLPGVEPVDAWFMGLEDAAVMWYAGTDGYLKVIAGATDLGTVLAAGSWGSADWVDGEELAGIVGSFIQL